ncbi:type II toxin-antitoxin system RelE family toxin [Azomonas macrocytogenes]|uniref:mRNA interferase RelE/StbE n=1 Tax=Azomonas macrocytogenes TaxID=69962 RepID=A0A839TBH9_AZOMA|nr:type II toxin-antitoxin system RelE/ParE family toxin [Azomonas macrocytogenes]MBB3105415.1 mRNA interferase RelE/StbE [Azomonas macrocytogenes]
MAWRIEFDRVAERELGKLDPQIAKHILLLFLQERVSHLENPRSIGEALKDLRLRDFWKYRAGNYRIISSIETAPCVC